MGKNIYFESKYILSKFLTTHQKGFDIQTLMYFVGGKDNKVEIKNVIFTVLL